MIKKLLNFYFKTFTNNKVAERKFIEKYLSKSLNSYDLENRIHELDKLGVYNKFYH
tara:strand:- start:443 stop:610 length:168 start_codon:yes stop_codon:yes gene_type:complete